MDWNRKQAFQFLETRWRDKAGFWAARGDKDIFLKTGKFTHCYSPNTIKELWSSGLIADLLLDYELSEEIKRDLIEKVRSAINLEGLCVSFSQPCLEPADVDATAICTSILLREKKMNLNAALSIVNRILTNLTQEGIIKVWFVSSGPLNTIVDIAICASGLYLIYLLNKELQAKKTEDFIYAVLAENNFAANCYYYTSEDQLHYTLSRIVLLSHAFRHRFQEILKEKVQARIGKTFTPLNLAQRILAAVNLGIENLEDFQNLRSLQKKDGSWSEDVIFQYPQTAEKITLHGSKEISTAFAIRALSDASHFFQNKKPVRSA